MKLFGAGCGSPDRQWPATLPDAARSPRVAIPPPTSFPIPHSTMPFGAPSTVGSVAQVGRQGAVASVVCRVTDQSRANDMFVCNGECSMVTLSMRRPEECPSC